MDNEVNNGSQSNEPIEINNVPVHNIIGIEEQPDKKNTKIVEEIVTDATGLPKLVRKEVPINPEPELVETMETPKQKKKHILPVLIILLILGGCYYYFFIYSKGNISLFTNDKETTIKEDNKSDEPVLNPDDYYIYFKRDTASVVFSNIFNKAYKLLATYKCASVNKCVGVIGNKSYALIKDDEELVLYDISKSNSNKLSKDYSKYTKAEFKVDKKGNTKGINFIINNEEKLYEIKEG